jgi:hypothetical protein
MVNLYSGSKVKMATLDEITKEKQRLGEALARVDAQRETLVSQLGELEATRACARALQHGRARKKDVLSQNADQAGKGGYSSATARPQCDTKISWQPQVAEPQRSGPCSGNRQDAARNHRCIQRRSPKPCRCRDCSTQTGRPHRLTFLISLLFLSRQFVTGLTHQIAGLESGGILPV